MNSDSMASLGAEGKPSIFEIVNERLSGLSHEQKAAVEFTPEEATDYLISCARVMTVDPNHDKEASYTEITRDDLVKLVETRLAQARTPRNDSDSNRSQSQLGGWLRNIKPQNALMGSNPYGEEILVRDGDRLYLCAWGK